MVSSMPRPAPYLFALSLAIHTSSNISRNQNRKLSKGAGSVGREQLLALSGAVRKGELEVFRNELLDVWAADGVEIGDFDHLEDLRNVLVYKHACYAP